jgi:diguanylate cyclase (GGDEF)-like protein/PAS domain S-box-containing protein
MESERSRSALVSTRGTTYVGWSLQIPITNLIFSRVCGSYPWITVMPTKRIPRVKFNSPRIAERDTHILFAGNPLPMWIYDVKTLRFLEVNDSAVRQYGYTREEFLSLTINDIRPQMEVPTDQDHLHGSAGDLDKVWINVKKDGTQIYVKIRANDVRFRGKSGRYVVAEDVTERRHLQAELLRLAHHDGLTGLPNRILLEQRMSQSFESARKRGHRAGLICLDLDRFKQVNDWYGHAIGDECLKQVGTMLTRRLRGMDTVARTGGEEFTIVLGEVESVAAAGIVAKALLQVFSSPVEVEGHSIVLGASMGVAVYPDQGTDSSELWRSADAAMYRAKRAGGNRHELVASDLTTVAVENAGVDAHMRKMLRDGGFCLHYQLQYKMNGEIRGMEALLRLPHPNLSYVSTDRFISMAEENGLIHPLGKWVVEEACRQLMLWNSGRTKPVRITVNVSPLQLMRSNFVAEVRQVISESGIDPAWLEMEITERVVLNFDEIAKRMEELAEIGIRFAVDDFGTGYSSLQHLQRLPISTLKIDRSFVHQLSESSRSYPIVKAIIAMGHSLQMEVIAEGVETEDQMQVLRKLGCKCVQGFLLSHPSPPDVIESILNK